MKLNVEISEKEKARDKDFFKSIMRQNLIFRRANGEINNKEQYIEKLSEINYEILESSAIKVLSFEGVKVISLIVHAKGTRKDMPLMEDFAT